VVSVASSFYPYKHMNFTARSSKEGSREQLFFAELQLCSRKQNPSGFNVICCEPLGSDSTGKFSCLNIVEHQSCTLWKNVCLLEAPWNLVVT
jgi:hypothetical protein